MRMGVGMEVLVRMVRGWSRLTDLKLKQALIILGMRTVQKL